MAIIAESKPKRKRFNKTVPVDCEAAIQPPCLTLEQATMGRLLPNGLLNTLAQRVMAGDVRKRKLTCELFFWLMILAVGPGGPLSLHKILSFLTVAAIMAGQSLQGPSLSKEAISENLRERSWQFFDAVLAYLLSTYGALWDRTVGQMSLAKVEQLRVMLMDATLMRVARRLIEVFPACANGKCKDWAAVKLHMAFYVFHEVPQIVAITEQKRDERHVDFLRPLGEAILYIFDMGYWTYKLFDAIIDRQQHLITRLRPDCNPRILQVHIGSPEWVGKRLKDITLTGSAVDCLVNVSSDNQAHTQMKHDVRLVGQWNVEHQRWHLYITSLVAQQPYSPGLIVDLYRLRWQIEILFRNLKSVLRIANFISVTENGVRVQICAALIHYMLTQIVILKAAKKTGRHLTDFSVPYCLDAVQEVLRQTYQLIHTGQTPNWGDAIELMVRAVIASGLRPNRKRSRLPKEVQQRLPLAGSCQPAAP